MTLYFSRARMKRDPAIETLADLLVPTDPGARSSAAHRLVWSLFAGDKEAKRDFLFKQEDTPRERGRAGFLILSKRPPDPNSPLFDVETKDFAPLLVKGDRLAFSLFANPAINRVDDSRDGKPRRHDVVMDALKAFESGTERKEARPRIIEEAGHAWLASRARRSGFALSETDALRIDGYDSIEIGRAGGRSICASVLQFDGVLEVEDPHHFLHRIAQGFGRARAFGCGLMLIRRA